MAIHNYSSNLSVYARSDSEHQSTTELLLMPCGRKSCIAYVLPFVHSYGHPFDLLVVVSAVSIEGP